MNSDEKAMNSLKRIKKRISESSLDNSDMNPPSYHEILMEEAHWEDINFIYSIMEKYRDGDFERFMHEIESDLVKLSAGILRISTLVGYLKGSVQHADGVRRVLRSRYHLQAREAAEDLNIKLTEASAESISRENARDQYKYYGEVSMSHEMLSSLYFSARDFVRTLEGVAARLQREKFDKY